MRDTMIGYDPNDSEYMGAVVINKITHLTKSEDGEKTYIHLINGGKLVANESINTLQARINLASKE